MTMIDGPFAVTTTTSYRLDDSTTDDDDCRNNEATVITEVVPNDENTTTAAAAAAADQVSSSIVVEVVDVVPTIDIVVPIDDGDDRGNLPVAPIIPTSSSQQQQQHDENHPTNGAEEDDEKEAPPKNETIPPSLLQDTLKRMPLWDDTFFDDKDSYINNNSTDDNSQLLLTVFDLDYDSIQRVEQEQTCCWTIQLLCPIFWPFLCSTTLTPGEFRLETERNSQPHVAVTRKGILIVLDKINKKTGCGCRCCCTTGAADPTNTRRRKQQQEVIFVPFVQINRITIHHIIPGVCGKITGLTGVKIDCVDNAGGSGSSSSSSSVVVKGLKNPNEFVKLIAVACDVIKKHPSPINEIPSTWKLPCPRIATTTSTTSSMQRD